MENFPVEEFHFLIFIIPGFVTVWTFRYFTNSDKNGDFELLRLSFFWGLMVMIFYQLLMKMDQETISRTLKIHMLQQ